MKHNCVAASADGHTRRSTAVSSRTTIPGARTALASAGATGTAAAATATRTDTGASDTATINTRTFVEVGIVRLGVLGRHNQLDPEYTEGPGLLVLARSGRRGGQYDSK